MKIVRTCGLFAMAIVAVAAPSLAQFQSGFGAQQSATMQQGSETRHAAEVTRGPVIEYADDQFAVISWSTEAPSDSRIYYGNDPKNLTRVAEGPSNATAHRVHISGLSAGTKYYFQIENGQAGTPGQPTDSFETVAAGAPPIRNQKPVRVAAAVQGPVITRGPNIQYSDDRSAVVTWTTDKPAPNVIYYGTSQGNLSQTAEGSAGSTYHRITLLNLSPATQYYFQLEMGQAPGARVPTYLFQTVAAGAPAVYDRIAAQAGTGAQASNTTATQTPALQQRPRETIYKGGLLVPAGTEIHAALETALSSKTSRVGDQFTAAVTGPVVAQNGSVAIPAGAKIRGQVSNIEQGKVLASVRGRARMDLRFTDVVLPNGTTLPITATLTGFGENAGAGTNEEGQVTDKTRGSEVAKDVGIGAGLGTVAGLLFGGALKGLAIGALAGGGYVLATQGRDVQLPADSPMVIRLDHQLSIPPSGTRAQPSTSQQQTVQPQAP